MSEISDTLRYEKHSALFWSENLGGYSSKMTGRTNAFALLAALIAALTGLAVWATLADSSNWVAQLVVSVMALTAAGVGMWPNQANYAECAKEAAELAGEYGKVLVKLRRASDHLNEARKGSAAATAADREVDKAIEEFQKIRARKESLRPYPTTLEEAVKVERDALGLPVAAARLAALRGATVLAG